jgi:hypothetical protein
VNLIIFNRRCCLNFNILKADYRYNKIIFPAIIRKLRSVVQLLVGNPSIEFVPPEKLQALASHVLLNGKLIHNFIDAPTGITTTPPRSYMYIDTALDNSEGVRISQSVRCC